MGKLPAITEHAVTVARVSVPTGLAAIAAMFPDWAPAVAIATPLAASITEYAIERPKRILMAELQRGEVVDLSGKQAAALVPMGYRFFLAARQGEYERNLRLLAAFLTAELKSEVCEPGSFADMTRRVEGLSAQSLHAIALIGEWERRRHPQDGSMPMPATVGLLCDVRTFERPLSIHDAPDAVSDLAGRGLLNLSVLETIGNTQQHYSTTQPLRTLIARALDIAQAEAGTAAQDGSQVVSSGP